MLSELLCSKDYEITIVVFVNEKIQPNTKCNLSKKLLYVLD